MERLELTVSPAQDGRTVGSLMRRELSMAEGLISSVKFRPDGILLNGKQVRTSTHVRAGDRLSVHVGDQGKNTAAPLDLPLDILWEDEALAVLDKPSGIAVYGEEGPNIAGILAYKWGINMEYHPVNRLDVGTSGIMVVAKDGYTHDRLRRMLHTEDFRREYLAVVRGVPEPRLGSVELPVSREPETGTRRSIDPEGLPARTEYRVLSAGDEASLVLLRLHTGRTHQIRLHMAAVGHPLVGDALYGEPDPVIRRPALHSFRLRLCHPLTGALLDLTAPIPGDLKALIEKAGLYDLQNGSLSDIMLGMPNKGVSL